MTARFGRKDLPEETNGNLLQDFVGVPVVLPYWVREGTAWVCCHEAGNHLDLFGTLAVRCPEAVFLVKRTDGPEHYKSRWVADGSPRELLVPRLGAMVLYSSHTERWE